MIRYYFPALIALQVLVAIILWGFPGPWLLATIPASFVCAATLAHWRRPREHEAGEHAVRPGVLVLGGLFTLLFGTAGMSLMWGATAPAEIAIERSVEVSVPGERLWAVLGDPTARTRWSSWMTDIEPIGKGGEPAPGSEYRATLMLERLAVPATLKVTRAEASRELTWQVEPIGGGRLESMVESVRMTPVPTDDPLNERFRIDYRLSYEVPTVLGRVSERIVVRRPAERMAEEALNNLRAVSIGVQ